MAQHLVEMLPGRMVRADGAARARQRHAQLCRGLDLGQSRFAVQQQVARAQVQQHQSLVRGTVGGFGHGSGKLAQERWCQVVAGIGGRAKLKRQKLDVMHEAVGPVKQPDLAHGMAHPGQTLGRAGDLGQPLWQGGHGFGCLGAEHRRRLPQRGIAWRGVVIGQDHRNGPCPDRFPQPDGIGTRARGAQRKDTARQRLAEFLGCGLVHQCLRIDPVLAGPDLVVIDDAFVMPAVACRNQRVGHL